MSTGLRRVMNVAAGAATVGTLALGGAWLSDRAHRWDAPRWEPRAFVRLHSARRGGGDAWDRGTPSGARWVMPVNPRCEHCMATLHRLDATWAQGAWKPELIALIVDTPRRPREGALARIPTDQIWWDVHDLWRGRWGHRLYGELIQFDGAGRFVRTVLAEDIIRSGRLPLPDESMAPATPDREGG